MENILLGGTTEHGAVKGLVKKYWRGGVGWSREGVGHQFLNPWQVVGRAIFSYP